MEKFTVDKIDCWISEIDKRSSIATTQPHTAYALFTHGLISKMVICFTHSS